jgi:hypothetical protein
MNKEQNDDYIKIVAALLKNQEQLKTTHKT